MGQVWAWEQGVEMRTMTPKQERFCQEIVKGKSQVEAYRVTFPFGPRGLS